MLVSTLIIPSKVVPESKSERVISFAEKSTCTVVNLIFFFFFIQLSTKSGKSDVVWSEDVVFETWGFSSKMLFYPNLSLSKLRKMT